MAVAVVLVVVVVVVVVIVALFSGRGCCGCHRVAGAVHVNVELSAIASRGEQGFTVASCR